MHRILAKSIVVVWGMLVIATGAMYLKEQIVHDPADGHLRFRTPEEIATDLMTRTLAPQSPSTQPR